MIDMPASPGSRWFLRTYQRPGAKFRLFCFPYAGGAALIYRTWASRIPSTVEIVPVELPGRGARLTEPPFRNLPELINALTPMITPLLDMRFAFFGHSMGAIIAFELARELRRRNAPQPEQLFISGRRPPQIPDTDPITYNLPEDEFQAELLRLKGTPIEVLENAELMSLMRPILRADFELIQTYQYDDDTPLHYPITVYGGLQDDDVPRALLVSWKQQTDARFSLHMLPGDHFFLHSASPILLELLGQELLKITAAR
jgi:medium-chain acyl-[acyl-carrier-protein] hydrolase